MSYSSVQIDQFQPGCYDLHIKREVRASQKLQFLSFLWKVPPRPPPVADDCLWMASVLPDAWCVLLSLSMSKPVYITSGLYSLSSNLHLADVWVFVLTRAAVLVYWVQSEPGGPVTPTDTRGCGSDRLQSVVAQSFPPRWADSSKKQLSAFVLVKVQLQFGDLYELWLNCASFMYCKLLFLKVDSNGPDSCRSCPNSVADSHFPFSYGHI